MAELLFPDPRLADEVVLLRPWRQTDVPGKLKAFGDPVVQRLSWPHTTPYTEADARTYFVGQEQARQRGEELNFAFVAEARRRGVASRAVRLMAGWAFSELALARLEISCGPDSAGSQRVAERCGFVREGVLRSHRVFKGGRRDTVVFGLLPGEAQ